MTCETLSHFTESDLEKTFARYRDDCETHYALR
jgi:hypothetical protein